jgi:hypothetical protein
MVPVLAAFTAREQKVEWVGGGSLAPITGHCKDAPGLGFLASLLTQSTCPCPAGEFHAISSTNPKRRVSFILFFKMVIVDGATGEPDVGRLFTALTELMEQTNSHRTYTAQLHAQASGIKVRSRRSLYLPPMTRKGRPRRYTRKQALCYDGM